MCVIGRFVLLILLSLIKQFEFKNPRLPTSEASSCFLVLPRRSYSCLQYLGERDPPRCTPQTTDLLVSSPSSQNGPCWELHWCQPSDQTKFPWSPRLLVGSGLPPSTPSGCSGPLVPRPTSHGSVHFSPWMPPYLIGQLLQQQVPLSLLHTPLEIRVPPNGAVG